MLSFEIFITWSVWLGVKRGGWKMRIFPSLIWWKRGMMEKGSSEVFHSGIKNHPPEKLGGKVGKKCLIH